MHVEYIYIIIYIHSAKAISSRTGRQTSRASWWGKRKATLRPQAESANRCWEDRPSGLHGAPRAGQLGGCQASKCLHLSLWESPTSCSTWMASYHARHVSQNEATGYMIAPSSYIIATLYNMVDSFRIIYYLWIVNFNLPRLSLTTTCVQCRIAHRCMWEVSEQSRMWKTTTTFTRKTPAKTRKTPAKTRKRPQIPKSRSISFFRNLDFWSNQAFSGDCQSGNAHS